MAGSRAHAWPSERRIWLLSKYLAAMAAKDAAVSGSRTKLPSHGNILTSHRPRSSTSIPNIDHRFGDGRARNPRDRGSCDAIGSKLTLASAEFDNRGQNQRARESQSRPAHRRLHVPQSPGGRFRRHQHSPRRPYDLPPLAAGETCTVDFYIDLPACTRRSFRSRRPSPTARSSTTPSATGSTTRWCFRWTRRTRRSTARSTFRAGCR